tara:strand:+ start:1788 stop:2051 length:264 start_codon:yes stop_codon:yes gene_type:complete
MEDEPTIEETRIQKAYEEALGKALEMFSNDGNPLEIAASFVNVGLSFYKTVLDDEDSYNLMVDTISDRRHDVADYNSYDLDETRVLH